MHTDQKQRRSTLKIMIKCLSSWDPMLVLLYWEDSLPRLHTDLLCTGMVKVTVTQSYPTLCDPVDCNPPGSSIHGILQGRTLEWVAIPFSRGSSQPTQGSNPGLLHCEQILYHLSHQGSRLVCFFVFALKPWRNGTLTCLKSFILTRYNIVLKTPASPKQLLTVIWEVGV